MKDQIIDVICQHSKTGSIIPIKIKLQDDDGEYQVYRINAYKPLNENGSYVLPNGVSLGTHIWTYECKITVFGTEKRVTLLYNSNDGKWTCRTLNGF